MIDPDCIQIRPCIQDAEGNVTSGNGVVEEEDAQFFGVYMIIYDEIPMSEHIADFDTRAEAEAFAEEITGGIEIVYCEAV